MLLSAVSEMKQTNKQENWLSYLQMKKGTKPPTIL